MGAHAPTFRGDLYSKKFIRDSNSVFKQIRDLGPAVWLPKRKFWAIGRYDDVKIALRANEVLISGKGIAANNIVNKKVPPIVLMSDADIHQRRRKVLIQPVMPGPLKELRETLEKEAGGLIQRLVKKDTFEAMGELCSHLPLTIVAERVGLNEYGRKHMLGWAAAIFNAIGPMNFRMIKGIPQLLKLEKYSNALSRESVTPGSWADRLFDAQDRGEISLEEAKAMIVDYVGPALDTTILATGEMLWRLAETPGAFDAVREDPSLIPGVVNESVRLSSPIRVFTRFAAADYVLHDTTIPKGDRVAILYASANYDERHYKDPNVFDVRRNPRDQVGWGHGPHACVGIHLARLEMEVILGALVQHVKKIEVFSAAKIEHNVLQGFKKLDVRLS